MKYFKIFWITLILILFAESAFITIDGLNDGHAVPDYILVLGNKVNPDGTLSPRLKARVEKGYELYLNNPNALIVVSGGLGKEGFYEGTEMKKYLVNRGVSENKIIVDDMGDNTLKSVNNFISHVKHPENKTIIVVSQFYHITRTKYLFRKEGMKNVYGAHADFFEFRDFYSLLRECIALVKYI